MSAGWVEKLVESWLRFQNNYRHSVGYADHGAVNQPFIVLDKKRGIIREGECTSQLVN